MNIYLLERISGLDFERMTGIVVVAADEGAARCMARSREPDRPVRDHWLDADVTSVELLGVGVGSVEREVLSDIAWS